MHRGEFPMSSKPLWLVPALCLALSSVTLVGIVHAGGEYVGERNSFNRFHGHGVYTYRNGAVYDGEWADGRKQGQGKQVQPDGSVYTGQWQDNLQNGQGRMKWANGDVYVGQWSAGHMHGKGVFTSANGDRYQGNFVVDQREGKGVLTHRNGESFDGAWKAGVREGSGTLTKPGVSVIAGHWSADKAVGEATVTFANGDRFIGGLLNDVANGKGICKSKSSSIACEFKEGKPMLADARTNSKALAKNEAVTPVNPVKPADIAPAKPENAEPLQASRSFIDPSAAPTVAKPTTSADIIRRTAAIESVNTAPAPAAGIPVATALATDAPQFSFLHDWNGTVTRDSALPVIFANKDSLSFGDVKIRAEGGDVAVTLVVDEYTGPGVYPLKYFKASIAKDGVASYQTAAAEPGEITVVSDDGKVIKGTFHFTAYRNGNPATQEKKTVTEGLFVAPVRSAGQSLPK